MDTKAILTKVAKLLAMAEDSAATTAEAATFRAKAEELMRAYRIEEEQLIAVDQTSIEPIRSDLNICAARNGFLQQYVNLSYYAAQHAGVRITWNFVTIPYEGRMCVAAFVGYEGDVRLAEYLFSAARLVFIERIEPAVDRSLTDEANIYRLRSAGITRREVAIRLWGQDTHAAHAKVAKVYKDQSDLRGERPALNGREVSASQFRTAYAEEFSWSFAERLRIARSAADAAGGGALVLAGREERVAEAFYTEFPDLRPSTAVAKTDDAKTTRKPKPRKVTKAQMAKWERESSAASLAGRQAGQRAAAEVDLGRGQAPQGRRIEESTGSRTALGS